MLRYLMLCGLFLLLTACSDSTESLLEDCLSYCQSYQNCYSTSVISDTVLSYCEDNCEEADSDDSAAIDPAQLRCIEYETCSDFKACVNGEIR